MYIIISVGVIVFIGLFAWIAVNLVDTLRSVKNVADNIESTTRDFTVIKDTFKVGALGLISTILGKMRGGEKK